MLNWKLNWRDFAVWCLAAAAPFLFWGFFYFADRYLNPEFFALCLGFSVLWALFLYLCGLLAFRLVGLVSQEAVRPMTFLAIGAGAALFYFLDFEISVHVADILWSATNVGGDLNHPFDASETFWNTLYNRWDFIVFSVGGALSGAIWGLGLIRSLKPRTGSDNRLPVPE